MGAGGGEQELIAVGRAFITRAAPIIRRRRDISR